ncbi:DUF2651 family protein [Clostridium sp. WILCCON 0269]|uniref:DUF2651 family protein n=1 Tax=Candidatus Clostridium eludens TaxID=3381663 RepID=A0ABW8SS20_9CLOT
MKNKNLFIKVILSLFIICAVFIILKSSINGDLLTWLLFGVPLFTFITSIVMQLLIKKKLIVLSVIFVVYLIVTFTEFDSRFLINYPAYTVIALIGTLIADLILKSKKV